MKQMLLALLVVCSSGMFAQQAVVVDRDGPAVPTSGAAWEIGIPVNTSPLFQSNNRGAGIGTVIGHTTYDLQSNSADPQRIVLQDNGHLSVTWTGAQILDVNPADRGTFYQYYDGSSWLAEPATRVEHVRTGWPSNIVVNGKELIYSHDFASNVLVRMSRNSIGTGSWNVETNTGMFGSWPRAASNNNSDTAHIVYANFTGTGSNAFTLYSRTPDGGANLDINAARLPGIDTVGGYDIMGADAYGIATRGNRVAVVSAGTVNDLAVWISDDRGDTWTRYRILDFPIDNFVGNVISDIDNDNVADTIVTNDAGHAIVIDNTGKVHVWTGRMRILDETPGDAQWSYFPGTNGLFYWHEGMGEDSIFLLSGVLDSDNSGDLNGIGADIPLYEVSLSGMPTAASDEATGRVFVIYAAMVEFSDYLGDPTDPTAQSFRDLYGMYTDDGGTTWSQPVNLTNGALQFLENVYPTAANTANGKVHVQWQRDEEPGTAYLNNPDPAVESEIVYHGFSYADFEPLPPVCGFTYDNPHGGLVIFTDTSIRPGTWSWDFDDLSTSTEQNPTHSFAANGTYNVCLTVDNSFGSTQCCQSITVSAVGVIDAWHPALHVYPNPTTDKLYIQVHGIEDAHVELYDVTGRVVYSKNVDLSTRAAVETHQLDSGVYLLQLTSEHNYYTQRVEVQR